MLWQQFIKAGRAVFSIENFNTRTRFTYKVIKHHTKDIWFVYVLIGPDNYSDFKFIGMIDDERFICTPNSKIRETALSWKAFNWLNALLNTGKELPSHVRIWHEGRCGRCGRRLTVPESIETGFGPECSDILGVDCRTRG